MAKEIIFAFMSLTTLSSSDLILLLRAVIFLEDRKPGQFAECNGVGYSDWIAGFTLVWPWDAPHGAYNMGFDPRYTLQVTGHL